MINQWLLFLLFALPGELLRPHNGRDHRWSASAYDRMRSTHAFPFAANYNHSCTNQ
jgi:hypothetical protein